MTDLPSRESRAGQAVSRRNGRIMGLIGGLTIVMVALFVLTYLRL